MNRNNEPSTSNDQTRFDRHFEAIGVQLRRIQTFVQGTAARNQLNECLDRILIRPVHRFAAQTANNFEQDIHNFTVSVLNFLDTQWREGRRQFFVRVAEDLEDLAAFLQDVAPFLVGLVDPQLNDPPFPDFLLGDQDNAGATDAEIQKLRRIEAGSQYEEQKCVICFDSYILGETLLQMPCGHVYHVGCVTSWLKRNAICPIDRETMFAPYQCSESA